MERHARSLGLSSLLHLGAEFLYGETQSARYVRLYVARIDIPAALLLPIEPACFNLFTRWDIITFQSLFYQFDVYILIVTLSNPTLVSFRQLFAC